MANFFVWYYLVFVTNSIRNTKYQFLFSMNKSRTIDMIRYLDTPLYNDSSSFGKWISLFIRVWWIGIGTSWSLIKIFPRVLFVVIKVVLPFVPAIQLINLLIV